VLLPQIVGRLKSLGLPPGRLKMRERKTRHRRKCKGGKRETGKCGTSVYGWKIRDRMLWNAKKRNNEQNCKVNNSAQTVSNVHCPANQ